MSFLHNPTYPSIVYFLAFSAFILSLGNSDRMQLAICKVSFPGNRPNTD